ncbi:hypothetical protein HO173_003133 [Letharia columbiana]|uniref:Uncharacterized protein n=1 Tax=Letharia columbiana TaxID=112416 RepID=A0A8H6G1C2_9LECA|nr:uncharacterized protein HO173_003133 [Letharia columbiana]KAF6238627.1 hypothetical protein HO173_003133 [Letharia columbiana]
MPSLHSYPSIAALLSSMLFQVIQCAPATSPLPSQPIYSLPPLRPSLPLNASDNGNCASTTKYPSWNSNDWVIEDCYIAVQQLYFREVLEHPDVAYEFVALGVSPTRSSLDSQRTPRKYIFRTCVLTIMMLDWFQPGQLPAGTKYNRAQTDVSTYRDIWSAARSIETACIVSKSAGWLMTGNSFS